MLLSSRDTLLPMVKKLWVILGRRFVVSLLILGLLYLVFIYLPAIRSRKDDDALRARSEIIELIREESLARSELLSLSAKDASIYSDLVAYETRYRELLGKYDAALAKVNKYFPDVAQQYAELQLKTRTYYLEFHSYFAYLDKLFAYSVEDDLLIDGSISEQELASRARATSAALTRYADNQRYDVVMSYQTASGDTVHIPNVHAYMLSSETTALLYETAECFDGIPSRLNHIPICSGQFQTLRTAVLAELQTTAQSQNTQSIHEHGTQLQHAL